MTMSELENRLIKHAETTKALMNSPFENETEEFIMEKKNYSIKRIAIIAAAVICVIGTSVFAAFRFLSAGEVASKLGDSKLAQYFTEQGTVSDTVCDGDYKATVLGITSGENLSSFKSSSWEVFGERTYAVVAIEKTDGSAMTFDDDILATPLIQGLNPMKYNIFTMNGGYTADITDGVLYRIIEFDSVEYFADRDVYMAILSESFMNNTAYSFDEATGEISANDKYDGTNILIKLNLDKSKANPQKAKEYLDKLNSHVKAEDDETEHDSADVSSDSEDEAIDVHENGEFRVDSEVNDGESTLIITQK